MILRMLFDDLAWTCGTSRGVSLVVGSYEMHWHHFAHDSQKIWDVDRCGCQQREIYSTIG